MTVESSANDSSNRLAMDGFLAPNKRIYSDLSITDEPDDMTLHRDGDEQCA